MPGGGSSGSVQPAGNQTTIQRTEPWDQQKPYLEFGFQHAQGLYNNYPQQYYPGSTVVPFSPQSDEALSSMEDRARTGSGIANWGKDRMMATVRGDYLNSNPYLDAQYNRSVRPLVENYRNAVAPGIAGQFASGGRYGSGAYQNMQSQAQSNLGRALGEYATDIYGRNYESERQRQNQAISDAPEYALHDYDDASRLYNIGGEREAQAGRELQDQVNRFNFAQQEPWARLGNYQSIVQGDYGRTQTTTQPIYRQQSPGIFQNLLGGAGGLGLLASGIGGLL